MNPAVAPFLRAQLCADIDDTRTGEPPPAPPAVTVAMPRLQAAVNTLREAFAALGRALARAATHMARAAWYHWTHRTSRPCPPAYPEGEELAIAATQLPGETALARLRRRRCTTCGGKLARSTLYRERHHTHHFAQQQAHLIRRNRGDR